MPSHTLLAAHVAASLKLAYYNVGGLTRYPASQLAPALLSSTCHADVIALGETWLLQPGSCGLHLPGYVAHHCVRSQAGPGRPEGGVSVFVHERLSSLRPSVRIDEEAGIVWLHLAALGWLVAACYFSPQGSTWQRRLGDPFALSSPLAAGLLDARQRGMHTILLGDLNARIGTACADVPAPGSLDLGPFTFDYSEYAAIPATRRSEDGGSMNVYGRNLLPLLQSTGLVLLNGRAPGDECGRLTFCSHAAGLGGRGGGSVIDLVCVPAALYPRVQQLQITPFSLDDEGHRMVRVAIALPPSVAWAAPRRRCRVARPDLSKLTGSSALGALDACVAELERVEAGLREAGADHHAAMRELTRILHVGSRRVAACLARGRRREHSAAAEWFDVECATSKALFHRARERYLRACIDAGLTHSGIQHAPTQAMHACHAVAVRARAAYNQLKKGKRRAWLEGQERAAIEAFFSCSQRQFWRSFMGGPAPAIPLGDIQVWEQHFSALFNPPPATAGAVRPAGQQRVWDDLLAQSAARAQPQRWAELNTDFTRDEVVAAIQQCSNGKAADLEGLTAEGLKLFLLHEEAGPAMLDVLTTLLNTCHESGLPPQACTSKLIPIPKGTAGMDPNSYRGIAVSSVFSRIYDSILFERANRMSEQLGVRAQTQCGFRSGLGPIDALFTMSHLVDHARHTKQKLYVCKVDLEKAFDLTSRPGMLQRAARLGITGKFARMLARIYDCVRVAVAINGQHSAPIPTSVGTKQGSQLSPLLFGWFVEQFTELVTMLDPAMGARVGNMLVANILYADDVNLISMDDPTQLQRQLDYLDLFCCMFQMRVNSSKTQVIVFRHPRTDHRQPTTFTYQGRPLPEVPSIVYMGVHFHCTRALKHSHMPATKAAGFKALFAMMARCRRGGLKQPAFLCRLFRLLVAPVISHGCQVWGPEAAVGKLDHPCDAEASKVQLSFLRVFAGLGKSAHSATLLREFNQLPIMYHWIKLAARQWNKLCVMEDDRMLKQAFLGSVHLYLAGCRACWVGRLLPVLHTLGVVQLPSQPDQAALLSLRVDEGELVAALQARFERAWGYAAGTDPRTATSQAVMAATYVSWVGMTPGATAPHLHTSLPFPLRQALLGLRVGSHKLEVQVGRYRGVLRHQRHCCVGEHDEPCVEDVAHFLLGCPAYASIRTRFPLVFAGIDATVPLAERVRHIFCTTHQHALAACVHTMLQHRSAVLAAAAGNED